MERTWEGARASLAAAFCRNTAADIHTYPQIFIIKRVAVDLVFIAISESLEIPMGSVMGSTRWGETKPTTAASLAWSKKETSTGAWMIGAGVIRRSESCLRSFD
jgi:hypothetical protein